VRVPAVDLASIEAPITIVVGRCLVQTAGVSVIALDPATTRHIDPKKIVFSD
jgi:hypothetical protein